MRLDKTDRDEFLKRFDDKIAAVRSQYEEYLRNDVRMGDYFSATFSFSMNWGESGVKVHKGNT